MQLLVRNVRRSILLPISNHCGTEVNKPNEIRNCFYYVAPEEKKEEKTEVVKKTEEAPLLISPSIEKTPPTSTLGGIAITGAVIGTTYKERPLTMGILTVFILLIVGLFIYSHAKNLRYWPFHFKFSKKMVILSDNYFNCVYFIVYTFCFIGLF